MSSLLEETQYPVPQRNTEVKVGKYFYFISIMCSINSISEPDGIELENILWNKNKPSV